MAASHTAECKARSRVVAAHTRVTEEWQRSCRRLTDAHGRAVALAERAFEKACKQATAAWEAEQAAAAEVHAAAVDAARAAHEGEVEALRASNHAKRAAHSKALAVRLAPPCRAIRAGPRRLRCASLLPAGPSAAPQGHPRSRGDLRAMALDDGCSERKVQGAMRRRTCTWAREVAALVKDIGKAGRCLG